MNGTPLCVIDTTVLQKANAPLNFTPGERTKIRKRFELLEKISDREVAVMISAKLVAEYQRQIPEPRNDFMRAFLAILDQGHAVTNWKQRCSGADREKARGCAYPREDDHVLRTAIRNQSHSTIYSEEQRMVKADECIHRRFRVHIIDPTAD